MIQTGPTGGQFSFLKAAVAAGAAAGDSHLPGIPPCLWHLSCHSSQQQTAACAALGMAPVDTRGSSPAARCRANLS